MAYEILPIMHKKAKRLGLRLRPSRNPVKKIDAVDSKGRITSFGGRGYGDYYVFQKTKGIAYAKKRRKLYKIRHAKDRAIRRDRSGKFTAGYLADQILW